MAYADILSQELQYRGLPLPVFGGEQSLGSVYVDSPAVQREVSADVTMVDFPQRPTERYDTIGFLHGVDVPRDPEQPLRMHFVQAAHGSHDDLGGALDFDHRRGVNLRPKGPGTRLAQMAAGYVAGSTVPALGNLVYIDFDRHNRNRRQISDRTILALAHATISLLGPHMFASLPANERDGALLRLYVGRMQTGEYEGRLTTGNLSSFDLTRVAY